ncbi:MAG: hypothetical protein EPO08_12390 [Rhodospirillaceae bacterium]|nr:MAG: hypothetical protein EPO08_12390 [Rhodospirillaceae bacterium]
MLFGQHFQIAYVTRNIDKALEDFQKRTGCGKALRFEPTVEVTTPTGSGKATNKIALIWIDGVQYELIEPVSGLVQVYQDALPADDGLQFHHICMRVPDWDEFRSQVERERYPVVIEGGGDDLRFLYLDARDFVGHYLEYTWMKPKIWAALGGR